MHYHRGIPITKFEGTQVGYRRPLSRERNSRKITGWEFTVDGYTRNADTLKEAKERIDMLLGEVETSS
jgi:hypothetical protein